jgi:hypothetical protein
MTTNSHGFIDSLDLNEVFVFGSNLQGHHAGGAARQAHEHFGAIGGVGVGLQGQSYGIPTMELDLENIALYIKQFIDFAELTSQYTYYVTPVGTGIAGFSEEEMEEVWSRWELPANVNLI